MLGYLDPGSGSIIASAAAAGFAGAAVAAKMGWSRVTGKLKRGAPEEEQQEAPEPAAEAAAEDPAAG
ncbi:MAG: hypothetical protein K0R11_670 [Acidimicrobiales bacterium]|jgi:hypothetical protein|nr:hypothetical protein [Acidimicrobiales bacterium]HZB72307.1 hypothetical protein [Acidimicrobiales bacterium]